MKYSLISKYFLAICIILFTNMSFATQTSVVSDSVITAAIKSKIALDQSISALHIGVHTKAGMVFLNGTVDSETQAEALFSIAINTHGVKDINMNDLSVKNSQHPIKDTYITAKVKTALISKHGLQNVLSNVHVETNNGVVYLSGIVKSSAQIDQAIKVARCVNGVRGVETRLVLQ